MSSPILKACLLIILALVSSAATAPGQKASASVPKPTPAPTPIPLAQVPLDAQSALASLQEIDANISGDQSSADGIAATLSDLTSEIDSRIADDRRLLTTSPSLDMLYRLKLVWETFGVRLSVSASELTKHATNLEEQLVSLDRLNKTWEATLQLAKQPGTPPAALQRAQSVVDSIARTRKAAESGRDHVLTLQSHLFEQEARVRTALSSIEQAETEALKNIFGRDSRPIWSPETSMGTEWERHSAESFSSQLKASAAFTKRLPFTYLIQALFIVLIATALHWMRRRIQKLAEEKPDLQRALPILDLPVSTAFALSILLVPVIYEQAPRLIIAIMGAITIIPAAVILRRLLARNSYPILNAIVILYFIGEFRILVAALPVLARCIFLVQTLGASVFFVWLLRSWRLPTEAAETHRRIWQTI
jgi:exonuclease VII small subunit